MGWIPKLYYFIWLFDSRIFDEPAPQLHVNKKELELLGEESKSHIAMYWSENDIYIIYGDSQKEKLEEEVEKYKKLFSSKPFRIILEQYHQPPPHNTFEELIVGFAAHEVRHRVQWKLSIKLITREDEKRVTDPLLACMIKLATVLEEARSKVNPSHLNDPRELDAKIIEFIASAIWRKRGRKGRTLEELCQLIRSGGETLLEGKINGDEEGNSSFLFIFFFQIRQCYAFLSLILAHIR
jgi:hypothetical protein